MVKALPGSHSHSQGRGVHGVTLSWLKPSLGLTLTLYLSLSPPSCPSSLSLALMHSSPLLTLSPSLLSFYLTHTHSFHSHTLSPSLPPHFSLSPPPTAFHPSRSLSLSYLIIASYVIPVCCTPLLQLLFISSLSFSLSHLITRLLLQFFSVLSHLSSLDLSSYLYSFL